MTRRRVDFVFVIDAERVSALAERLKDARAAIDGEIDAFLEKVGA